jgi:hypothetical protein
MMIKGSYPNVYKDIDEVTSSLTISMWHSAFQDMPANLVFSIAQQWVLNQNNAPTIAQLREQAIKMTNPNALVSCEEAWETVIKAVKNYGYYRQDEAFKTLSEPTKRAVKVIGWANICRSENIGIERANFYKTYNALEKDNKEKNIVPKAVYEKLQNLSQQMRLEKQKGD